jgi:hypothetical protein
VDLEGIERRSDGYLLAVPSPQQPDIRTDTTRGGDDALPEHLIPEDNRAGHHPVQEQDQPDLDHFAERLGLHERESDADASSVVRPGVAPDQLWPLGVIRAIAVGRAVIGAAGVLARPSWLEFALGPSAKSPLARALARMVGVRDAAIGVATFAAPRESPRRAQLLAVLGAICDATDAIAASTTARLHRRARRLTVPAASLSALVNLIAAAALLGDAPAGRAPAPSSRPG